MDAERAERLRIAIEHLVGVKLQDALTGRAGIDRLIAHRGSGVASPVIRDAERRLERALSELLPDSTRRGGGRLPGPRENRPRAA